MYVYVCVCVFYLQKATSTPSEMEASAKEKPLSASQEGLVDKEVMVDKAPIIKDLTVRPGSPVAVGVVVMVTETCR